MQIFCNKAYDAFDFPYFIFCKVKWIIKILNLCYGKFEFLTLHSTTYANSMIILKGLSTSFTHLQMIISHNAIEFPSRMCTELSKMLFGPLSISLKVFYINVYFIDVIFKRFYYHPFYCLMSQICSQTSSVIFYTFFNNFCHDLCSI